jgi:DNA polymerase-3 subunit alpha
VTVKRIQPFEGLAATARFAVELTVSDPAAFPALAALLADHRGARGEIRARVSTPDGEATLLLGRDFLLDAELAGRLESLHGVASVEFKAAETRLQLVG